MSNELHYFKMETNEHGFSNIIINIAIPVLILKYGAKLGLSPVIALIVALSFPLINGLYTLIKNKKVNFVALLGLANISVSGILTLLALGGIWFAIKEAVFPLLIGVFVYISSRSQKPFFETLFLNPTIFDVAKLNSHLETENKKNKFHQILVDSTRYLSFSFLFSASLNFILSLYIFKPLSNELTTEEKQHILNQQLSQMTMTSLVVILIPTVIFVGLIMYNASKKTAELTGLKFDDLVIKTTKI